MMGGYWNVMGLWAWTLLALFGIAIIGLIVWCAMMVSAARARSGDPGDESAVEILDRRFARGAIDENTFQAQRAALMKSPPSGR